MKQASITVLQRALPGLIAIGLLLQAGAVRAAIGAVVPAAPVAAPSAAPAAAATPVPTPAVPAPSSSALAPPAAVAPVTTVAPVAPVTTGVPVSPLGATPAASATAVSTPAVSTPPVSTPPVSTPPVSTPAAPAPATSAATGAIASASGLAQVAVVLLLVVGLIAGMAWLLRRLGIARTGAGTVIRVVSGVSLSNRERILVVEIADQWIVVGVSPGRINTLATMPRQETPDGATSAMAAPGGKNFALWLKQTIDKRNSNNGKPDGA